MCTKVNSVSRTRGWGLAALAMLFTAGPTAAEDEGWQPPPPMPDTYDWVQTTSLEWLKGEIIAMYDDKLEFDSDEFELTKTLDFDITVIWDRTQNPQPESDGVVPKQDDIRLVFFLGVDF